MNAARLGRLLEEAGDDRTRWAEANYDEVTDQGSGLVTRDHLDRRFAEFETKFVEFRNDFAAFKSEMSNKLVFTQVGSFIALAILILFTL